jgi:hypothetical protein
MTDLLRNVQILAAEEYLNWSQPLADRIDVIPTAKLIREVERFGCAREDATKEQDLLAAIDAYPDLKAHKATMANEWRRYEIAFTDVELQSVFRSIAPIVEQVAKELLLTRGSTTSHPTLGPVIGELRSRKIGGIALWSQLDHILKFGRDLAQHGSDLPDTVVRIACANAFELLPQLGALFP